MHPHHSPVGWPDGRATLPTPSGWAQQRPSMWLRFSMWFVAAIAISMAAEAAWLAGTGQLPAGVPLVGAALFLGHVVALSRRVWRPRRRSSRTGTFTQGPDGATGVTFTYSAWSYYLVAALLVMSELVLIAVGLGGALSATVVGVVVAIVIGAVALVVGWVLIIMLRLAPGEVVLSPAGVYHRGLSSTQFVPWDAIVGVSALWVGTPIIAVWAMPSPDIRVRSYTGRFGSRELRWLPTMLIRTAWLATDPAIVYHALVFYASHPDSRTELGTPDGLDRISNGRAIGEEKT
jgi:hypothetical protein